MEYRPSWRTVPSLKCVGILRFGGASNRHFGQGDWKPRLLTSYDVVGVIVLAIGLTLHSLCRIFVNRRNFRLFGLTPPTGWSEPVPGWEFHPLLTSAFHGAPEFQPIGSSQVRQSA
jgi:hypothetical protein